MLRTLDLIHLCTRRMSVAEIADKTGESSWRLENKLRAVGWTAAELDAYRLGVKCMGVSGLWGILQFNSPTWADGFELILVLERSD